VSCDIFGSSQNRCRLQFHDLLVWERNLPTETLRPMVSLNRFRRTAEAHRLFLIETAPNLNGLRFENADAITGHISNSAQLHLLLAGLKMLFAWGGGASRGLGWGSLEANAWLNDELLPLNINEVKALCRS
jgi:hypothetical protein